jgi:hypothetical protein
MAPHGPLPNPENLRYVFKKAVEKVGSVYHLSQRLGIAQEDLQRILEGEIPVSDRLFLACVDILFETPQESIKKPRKRP